MRLHFKLIVAALSALTAIFSFSGTSHAAPPTCVANMISGTGTHGYSYQGRSLKVVLHRQDSLFVGYADSYSVGLSPNGFARDPNGVTASAPLNFEFSDRYSSNQNFTRTSTEAGSITVNLSTGATTINVFGANFGPVVPSCANNLIFYTTNNMEFWTITFSGLANYVTPF